MKIAGDFKDFLKDFEKKVYTPLERKFKKGVVHPLKDDFLRVLKNELPKLLYGWITSAEAKPSTPGIVKYMGVMKELVSYLHGKGLQSFVPVLVPVIEMAVRWIYQKTVESIFDKLGLEDNLEAWLGFSVDSGSSASTPPSKPATAPGK